MSALGGVDEGRYVGAWRQVRGVRDRFSHDKGWISDPQSHAVALTADGLGWCDYERLSPLLLR